MLVNICSNVAVNLPKGMFKVWGGHQSGRRCYYHNVNPCACDKTCTRRHQIIIERVHDCLVGNSAIERIGQSFARHLHIYVIVCCRCSNAGSNR